jgi:hypothetical protein
MVSTTFTRSTAAAGAVGLCGASLFGASAAVAAPVGCSYPGSTEVAPDVCQVVLTADGVYTFPAALNKVSAVLVGAGGGGYYNIEDASGPYGGGGGEVVYVDTVALDTAITVDIGAGGAAGSEATLAGDGDDTVFGAATARGGLAPEPDTENPTDFLGGTSGNGNTGSLAGGGAAGAATSTYIPGPGYLLSGIPGVDPELFPASADGGVEYGPGGVSDFVDDPLSLPIATPYSGAGGSAQVSDAAQDQVGASAPGEDGVVIVRYAPAALAETGVETTGALVAAAAAATVGVALVATAGTLRRRRRRTS